MSRTIRYRRDGGTKARKKKRSQDFRAIGKSLKRQGKSAGRDPVAGEIFLRV